MEEKKFAGSQSSPVWGFATPHVYTGDITVLRLFESTIYFDGIANWRQLPVVHKKNFDSSSKIRFMRRDRKLPPESYLRFFRRFSRCGRRGSRVTDRRTRKTTGIVRVCEAYNSDGIAGGLLAPRDGNLNLGERYPTRRRQRR